MKKLLSILIMVFLFSISGASAQDGVKIFVNDSPLLGEDKAVIQNDITMVPFRDIFEALGAHVEWFGETKTIVASSGVTVIKMQIDEKIVNVSGEGRVIDTPPTLINGNTMVPLRSISEMLNAGVNWDGDTKTVSVYTNKSKLEHKEKAKYLTIDHFSKDGVLLVKTIAAYPEFEESNNKVLSEIADVYKTTANEAATEFGKIFEEEALERLSAANIANIPFEPIVLVYGYEIVYDRLGYISVLEQAEIACENAFYFDAKTFSAESGEAMPKETFIHLNKAEVAELEPYSVYLYEGSVVLCLNSDNMIYAEHYNYPFSTVVPEELVKFNPKTGEITEPPMGKDDVGDVGVENPQSVMRNLTELNKMLGFSVPQLMDQVRNVPISYIKIGDNLGEIKYNRDDGASEVTVRKSRGDSDISGVYGTQKISEELYKQSMVEYKKNENCIYSTFAIKKEDGIFSYSIVITNHDDMYALKAMTKEIIDKEI